MWLYSTEGFVKHSDALLCQKLTVFRGGAPLSEVNDPEKTQCARLLLDPRKFIVTHPVEIQ
jgi:hypothetical protein